MLAVGDRLTNWSLVLGKRSLVCGGVVRTLETAYLLPVTSQLTKDVEPKTCCPNLLLLSN